MNKKIIAIPFIFFFIFLIINIQCLSGDVTITFKIPSAVAFQITVCHPQVSIYTKPEIVLNVTSNSPPDEDTWVYSLNFQENQTFDPNTTILAYPDDNFLDVCANSTNGTWSCESVDFNMLPEDRLRISSVSEVDVVTTITNRSCVDSLLTTKTDVYKCVTDYCFWVNQTQTEYCPNGCAANNIECNSPIHVNPMIYVAIVLALILMSGIFTYMGTRISDEHGSLQFLFFGASFIVLIVLLGLLSGFVTFGQTEIAGILTGGYQFIIYAFILVILYFLIKLFWSALQNFYGSKR